ncbi:hypothetical protein IT881_06055 [Erythrobacter sp. A30-3]|jgi:hypothetical protein|nr:hypothetical protein IT881_06055 [Erythrobacter sp. A30-3]
MACRNLIADQASASASFPDAGIRVKLMSPGVTGTTLTADGGFQLTL